MIVYVARDEIYKGLYVHLEEPRYKKNDLMWLSFEHFEAPTELKERYSHITHRDKPIKLEVTFVEVKSEEDTDQDGKTHS
jgi:hypothetical protein